MENLKIFIEITILSLLVLSLLTIIVLMISKSSQIRLLKTQIENYKNKTKLEIELNTKMSFYYSLVSNAVYIGLLGTTLGIIVTLQSITGEDQGQLIASLSLPLFSTACSIIVAIIGTFCFNSTNSKIEEILKIWDMNHDNKETF